MAFNDENWNVLVSLFPTEWQEIALRSGAFVRLREFPSPELHAASGYSLRETVVQANLAHAAPWKSAIRDAKGNLYGTTSVGGAGGFGTVWKIAG